MTTPALNLSSPYVGPRSFGDGDRLYGRDREAQELCDLLISERIVLLHSPSGAGKTSLVQALLIPMLRERDFTVLPPMRVSQELPPDLDPGANRYLLSLMLSLQRQLPPERQLPVGELAQLRLGDLLARLPGQQDGQVLIFDQFEEILTVDPTNVKAKHDFFIEVGAALRDRSRWALFVMREDYLAALAPFLRPVPTRLGTTFRLDLLEAQAAAQAISGPAADRGVAFAHGTVTGLVADLSMVRVQHADGRVERTPGPYVEPVQLQVVCLRLWKTWLRRRAEASVEISADDIAAMGDVGKALEDYYDECLAEVQTATGTPERAMRDWFDGQLITARGLRNQVLKGQETTQDLANGTIDELIDTYLVRAEQRRGLTWFELAHDRLIEPVLASNRTWRDQNLQQFQRQAVLWQAQGRPEGLLLRGKALEAAEEWLTASRETPNAAEAAYLEQSKALRRRERQAHFLRLTIWGLAALAFVVAIIAVNQAIAANTERRNALVARDEARARQLAAQSDQLAGNSLVQALLLAVEATGGDRAPLPEAVAALQRALALTGGVPLSGHAGEATTAAFSPDSALLATGDEFGAVRLWRVADPAAPPVILSGQDMLVEALTFSPDGALLAVARDTGVTVWRVAAPTDAPALLPYEASILALAFSPDGALIAAGAGDGVVLVWRAADLAAPPLRLEGHEEAVQALAFTPDGRLVTASEDATARVWTLGAEPDARVLEGHEDELRALAISPNGALLATGDAEGAVLLWSLDDEDEPVILGDAGGAVQSMTFSPDGRNLAVGDDDGGTAVVWEVGSDKPPEVLVAEAISLSALIYTADGQTLIMAGADGSLQLWAAGEADYRPLRFGGHEAGINAMALSPDGAWIATAARDGTARLWPTATLSPVAALRPAAPPLTATFSADGEALIVGDADGASLRYTLGAAGPPERLHEGEGGIFRMSYSAGPRHVLSLDADGGLTWRPLDPPGEPVTLFEGGTLVFAAALSPDGAQAAASLATESDVALLLWATDQPDAPRPLPSGGLVTALAFSTDGARLASGDDEGLVRIWDLGAGSVSRELRAHGRAIDALAFSADGSLLASGDGEGQVYIWDLATGRAIAAPRAVGGLDGLLIAPDNGSVAGVGSGPLAWLWDLRNPARPVTLAGHRESLLTVALSPDATLLATTSFDGWVRLWPTSVEAMREAACATAGRNMRYDDWAAAFSPLPYRKTCPDLPPPAGLIAADILFPSPIQVEAVNAVAAQLVAAGYADELPARSWGALCRAGGLAGVAASVADACDRAVRLDPADGQLADWRAIVRAAQGDLAGAREDLDRYLTWAAAVGRDAEAIAARETWRAALAAGSNPYDEAALGVIRRESP